VRDHLTLNSMAQIHTSVTLITSRNLTWSSGRLTCQHASERRAGTTGLLRNLGSISGRDEGFIYSLRNVHIDPRTLLSSYSVPTAGLFFPGYSGRGVTLSTYLHLVPRLIMTPPPQATILGLVRFRTVLESFLFKT